MEARIFFSLDGERYQQTPLYFSLDTGGEDEWYRHPTLLKDIGGAARNITIPLQNRVGRFVRLELDFASKWLLLSEVYFDSGEYSTLFGANSQI
jgi:discoidin domain receptor family protein 2